MSSIAVRTRDHYLNRVSPKPPLLDGWTTLHEDLSIPENTMTINDSALDILFCAGP